MKIHLCRSMLPVSLSVVALFALACPAAPPTRPAVAASQDSGLQKLLPNLSFDGTSLDDVVDTLRQMSGLQLVLWRDPRLPEGYPLITARLKDISVEQFLKILTTEYSFISVESVPGANGSVEIIKVQFLPNAQPGDFIPERRTVRVFRLGDVVEELVDDPTVPGQEALALKQVLSLIQATLDQVDHTGKPPVLHVHQETRTLIFKGSNAQQQAVEEALRALMPSSGTLRRMVNARGQVIEKQGVEIQRLQTELSRYNGSKPDKSTTRK